MREQHHATCRAYLPDRKPWRPFTCCACDAIDHHLAHQEDE